MKLALAAAMTIALLAMSGCESTKVGQTSTGKTPGVAGAAQQPPQGEIPGVIDVGPKMSPQEAATKLVKGKTTLDEVLVLLGPPQHIAMSGDGARTVLYHWRKELLRGAFIR